MFNFSLLLVFLLSLLYNARAWINFYMVNQYIALLCMLDIKCLTLFFILEWVKILNAVITFLSTFSLASIRVQLYPSIRQSSMNFKTKKSFQIQTGFFIIESIFLPLHHLVRKFYDERKIDKTSRKVIRYIRYINKLYGGLTCFWMVTNRPLYTDMSPATRWDHYPSSYFQASNSSRL